MSDKLFYLHASDMSTKKMYIVYIESEITISIDSNIVLSTEQSTLILKTSYDIPRYKLSFMKNLHVICSLSISLILP